MQSYVINLDRSPERWTFMRQQGEQIGMTLHRIAAVDGATLTAEDIATARRNPFEFQPINAGELGLIQSHQRTWQKLIQSGNEYAAVFEDDAVLASNLPRTLAEIEQRRPGADIIKLETTRRRVACDVVSTSLSTGNLTRLRSWHGGTAGYVISAECAHRLLECSANLADPIDQCFFNPWSRINRGLTVLQLSPAACIQLEILERDRVDQPSFATTILRNQRRPTPWRHGPFIDGRRLAKKWAEKLRRKCLVWSGKCQETTIPFASNATAAPNAASNHIVNEKAA